ncbi:urea amidolyase associated protein UAAP2 [Wolinella succinogenes]|uniref:urea amidolyase associated protein UAAP2 n=1 Tax=Wolinella succinogenes TaxID=844 RepID=UPI00169EA7B3|nr:urea amidolyase associated protein UAAP2 [Wolinella succinogenes]NLU34508.1 urea carboxylase-associated family protein [Wolinella succinogenes]
MREAKNAIHQERVAAGIPWYRVVNKGEVIRIVDLLGCQAVDTLFYNAHNHEERYSAPDTIREQGSIFITKGTKLYSSEGNVMLEVVEDTCGNHDTLGGHCSAESNTVRFGHDKKYMHSCRDNYLFAVGELEMNPRDLTNNINFFMNVPVEENGHLAIVDGISKAGDYVEMEAKMDTLVLISNCPQLNNPCNGFNPTPIEILIWEA